MAKKAESKIEIGSAFDLLPKSLEIVKKNWVAFAVVNAFSLFSALTSFSPEYDKKNNDMWFSGGASSFGGISGWELGTILGIASIFIAVLVVVNVMLFAMMMVLHVRSSDGKSPTLGELFQEINKNWLWLRLIGLFLMWSLILLIGFILLVIPAIIAFGRIIMSPYIMIDKNLGVIDSLKASNQMAKDFTGKVWGAIGVTILVSIGAGLLGVIPIIGALLGTVLTIAYSLVIALRYHQLKSLKPVTVKK